MRSSGIRAGAGLVLSLGEGRVKADGRDTSTRERGFLPTTSSQEGGKDDPPTP